jgi:hypothetical protein
LLYSNSEIKEPSSNTDTKGNRGTAEKRVRVGDAARAAPQSTAALAHAQCPDRWRGERERETKEEGWMRAMEEEVERKGEGKKSIAFF